MYHIKDGTSIHYDLRGNRNKPALVFINSLGTDFRIWSSVINELETDYFIICFDKRGHGLSAIPNSQGSISHYANDLRQLLETLDISEAYICGISIGGLIAQALYHQYPNLVKAMVLSNTGYKIGDDALWNERISHIQANGVQGLAKTVIERWFSKTFYEKNPAQITSYESMFKATSSAGYIAACEALRDADFEAQAKEISVPVTCIASTDDISTPLDIVTSLSQAIPDARLQVIDGAGHLPCLENPGQFAKILRETFSEPETVEVSLEAGMKVRREVLGNSHVDLAENGKSDFDIPFQEYITRSAWASVWGRGHLTRRERSLLTIALMTALGHEDELAMHIRATVNTGTSKQDVSEVLLHTAVYAGVPTANTAIKIAKETYKLLEEQGLI